MKKKIEIENWFRVKGTDKYFKTGTEAAEYARKNLKKNSYCKQKCYQGQGRKSMIMLWTGTYMVCEECFLKNLERISKESKDIKTLAEIVADCT